MTLYRTNQGHVSHADAVPDVKAVPSRRQAEAAYCEIVSLFKFDEVEKISDQISTLRDFIHSR